MELPPRSDSPAINDTIDEEAQFHAESPLQGNPSVVPLRPTLDTPTTSQAPSEDESTQPTTPSSTLTSKASAPTPTSRTPSWIKPIVPVVPNLPSISRSSKKQSVSAASENTKASQSSPETNSLAFAPREVNDEASLPSDKTSKASSPKTKVNPKSWADLVRTKGPIASTITDHANGGSTYPSTNSSHGLKVRPLSDLLSAFDVTKSEAGSKISFLKPRGLVNTGNMCYMNSVGYREGFDGRIKLMAFPGPANFSVLRSIL